MFEAVAGRRVWLVLLMIAALAAGCATVGAASPEETVKQRAQARWAALIAADWDKAYGYMAPSYRALIERKRFASQFGGGVSWEGVEVLAVSCQEDRCTARIKILYRPVLGARSGEPASTHFNENWVREDGQWWMFERI